jgi:hypothetical protein
VVQAFANSCLKLRALEFYACKRKAIAAIERWVEQSRYRGVELVVKYSVVMGYMHSRRILW